MSKSKLLASLDVLGAQVGVQQAQPPSDRRLRSRQRDHRPGLRRKRPVPLLGLRAHDVLRLPRLVGLQDGGERALEELLGPAERCEYLVLRPRSPCSLQKANLRVSGAGEKRNSRAPFFHAYEYDLEWLEQGGTKQICG